MRRLYPLLLGVLVTGCGTPPIFQTLGEELRTPTPTVEPTPAPTVDRAGAAQAYLELATAYNAVLCERSGALDAGDLEQSKGAQAAVAEANRTLADGLRAIEFPEELAATKQELLMAFAAVERTATALANAATVEDYNAMLAAHESNQGEAGELSNFLRAELGLESTPGAPC